ncbi:MAG TPA: threonine/serine dehydratase [Gemmatimonadaceae bacterium]|nr:threonine/serine dehydratase [Gemmatimonadaceae bacterium]
MTVAPTVHLVSLSEIREAARTLRGAAVRTPLLPDAELARRAGLAGVWLKPEMLQRTGSFKFRGAYTFISRLSPGERAAGVVAPSSGNHAQAVAAAARLFDTKATLVMPTTVTPAKRAGVERYGGRVVLRGTTTEHRLEGALELVRDEGLTLVPPYDDPTIISGQGTAGLEIVEDLPDADTVIVPVGGGGLSAGVATAIKSLLPRARTIGVEPAGAPKLTRAREAGEPVPIEGPRSIADGLLAVQIGTVNFAHHQAFLDDVITVPDDAIVRAMRHLVDRMKLIPEPSGAITAAAVLEGIAKPRGKTVIVLSGGNIEWAGLRQLLGDE